VNKREIKYRTGLLREVVYEIDGSRSIEIGEIKHVGGKVDINHLLTLIKNTLIERTDDD